LLVRPIIISGGSGSRLWPLSSRFKPKQFININGEESFFKQTIKRVSNAKFFLSPLIICNEKYKFLVRDQCEELNISSYKIIVEPMARNTAPAILSGLLSIHSKNETCLVLPSDHYINDDKKFLESIMESLDLAKDNIVTFGVKPRNASQAYGYIKASEKAIGTSFIVEKFTEKPNLNTAKKFIKSGNYYWNAGMLLFRSSVMISETKKYRPELFSLVEKSLINSEKDMGFTKLSAKFFSNCYCESIDYAVLEHSSKLLVLPVDYEWRDIGSWSSIFNFLSRFQDKNNNVLLGRTVTQGTTNSLLLGSKRLIATNDIDNMIVVESGNYILVSKMESCEKIKDIVDSLEKLDSSHAEYATETYRPWGHYEVIDVGKFHQVKRLIVNKNSRLSLQKHKFRSEHWIVVEGSASIIINDKELELSKGESTFIPAGSKHSLINNTDMPLIVIEIQSGSYLGEDDIERFEDIYGRK